MTPVAWSFRTDPTLALPGHTEGGRLFVTGATWRALQTLGMIDGGGGDSPASDWVPNGPGGYRDITGWDVTWTDPEATG